MPFQATLSVNSKEFDVVHCVYSISQNYNANGQPASGVSGGLIGLVLEGSEDDSLADWMFEATKKQDGKITIMKDNQASKFEEIEFKGAYAIQYFENFSNSPENLNPDLDRVLSLLEMEQISTEKWGNYRRLSRVQNRTEMSYCVWLKISAEKISIHGVEHDNHW